MLTIKKESENFFKIVCKNFKNIYICTPKTGINSSLAAGRQGSELSFEIFDRKFKWVVRKD